MFENKLKALCSRYHFRHWNLASSVEQSRKTARHCNCTAKKLFSEFPGGGVFAHPFHAAGYLMLVGRLLEASLMRVFSSFGSFAFPKILFANK